MLSIIMVEPLELIPWESSTDWISARTQLTAHSACVWACSVRMRPPGIGLKHVKICGTWVIPGSIEILHMLCVHVTFQRRAVLFELLRAATCNLDKQFVNPTRLSQGCRDWGWPAPTPEHSPAERYGGDAGWWTSAMARRGHWSPSSLQMASDTDLTLLVQGEPQHKIWSRQEGGIILNSHKRHRDQQKKQE